MDFLLQTNSASRLYHDYAAKLPIIDYHSHLPAKQIADDHQFANMTEIWLHGDHYKWRAMRAAGIPERMITGDAPDWEKFQAWAEVVPKTLRNPLYHWTHLELRRPLGFDDLRFGPNTAPDVWKQGNSLLKDPRFSCRGIIKQMNVELVCTTDDPIDSLEYHEKIAADSGFGIDVLPTFRPDKALNVPFLTPQGSTDRTECVRLYIEYIRKLEQAASMEIRQLSDLFTALDIRHRFFHDRGCRLSDHGFGRFMYDEHWTQSKAAAVFEDLQNGKPVSESEELTLRSSLMNIIATLNSERGWTMQLHVGAIRNNRTRLYRELGPDCGCDSIGDGTSAYALSRFFDSLDVNDRLPKTIVYNLNPSDNEMLATMIANFQDGITPGKMQYGSGWWFLDQKDGMEKQLNTLSNQGLLSLFVGMLTDSRSFLSFTRHEYFRRILCNLLGSEMEHGILPNDFELIGSLVRDICYNNAKSYFGFR